MCRDSTGDSDTQGIAYYHTKKCIEKSYRNVKFQCNLVVETKVANNADQAALI